MALLQAHHLWCVACCRGNAKFTPADIRISFARLAHFGPYKTLLAQQSLGSIFWVNCLGASRGANATHANDVVFVVSGCPPVGMYVAGPSSVYTAAATVQQVEEADAGDDDSNGEGKHGKFEFQDFLCVVMIEKPCRWQP